MQVKEISYCEQIIEMDVTEALKLIHDLTAAVIKARGYVDGLTFVQATEVGEDAIELADGDEFERSYTLVVKAKTK